MSFVAQGGWIIAKVLHKFKSHYYNVELENGEKLSVQLKPPTAELVQSWTLVDPEHWQPTYQPPEQLRSSSGIASKEPSPMQSIPRDAESFEVNIPQLELHPHDELQIGHVYHLPDAFMQVQVVRKEIS